MAKFHTVSPETGRYIERQTNKNNQNVTFGTQDATIKDAFVANPSARLPQSRTDLINPV